MGYLSQKKHQIRESLFLTAATVVTAATTFGAFANPGFRIVFFNLFHLYCLSGILFLYTLFVSRYKFAAVFALLWLANYTNLAATVNIFLSDKFNGAQTLELTFDREKNLVETFAAEELTAAGNLILAGHYHAAYVVIGKETPLTIIRVDLKGAKPKEAPLIFKHLQEFISQTNTPVVIFGDFGLPAWSKPFKQFLDISGLNTKNRLIFTNGCPFNIFSSPNFYVLGFREMGITNISTQGHGKNKIIRTILSFNPAQL